MLITMDKLMSWVTIAENMPCMIFGVAFMTLAISKLENYAVDAVAGQYKMLRSRKLT